MHILIVNTVILNGGDAAILYATMDLLRAEFGADTTFVIHESQPTVAARYYPDLALRTRAYRVVTHVDQPRGRREWLRANIRVARFRLACELKARGLDMSARLVLNAEEQRLVNDFLNADVVVTTGGTYLVEHYNFTSRLFAIETARRLRRPVIFFTQSLGPFTREDTRRSVARAVNGAALVLLRDERSLTHLRDIPVRNEQLHVTADVVFAIADKTALSSAKSRGAFQTMRADGTPPRVAISVRSWSHFKRMSAEVGMAMYRDAIRSAVELLVKQYSAQVTFISTCQGIPEYFTDDSRTAQEIVDEMPEDVRAFVKVDGGFHTPTQLATKLRDFDLVISTRMHMAILALGVGTLVFPLAYEFKTRELFNRLGLGDYVHEMEGVNSEAFVTTLSDFLNNAAQVREKMFAGVELERQRAIESVSLVSDALQVPQHTAANS